MSLLVDRRRLIGSLGASAGGLLMSGCDRTTAAPSTQGAFSAAQALNMWAQRLVAGPHALAREYSPSQMSPGFPANGNTMPGSPEYHALAQSGFADWRLVVDGKVARPLSLSLDELKRMPPRTQITRHDCVEGWSAIGQWTGVPLSLVLKSAGISDAARYVVFHCADDIDGTPFYGSTDMAGAMHPQTILAWAMNGQPLSIGHGAPLRVRLERQLGYKHAKYIMRIQAVTSLLGIGGGKGGAWEDADNYQWYAGI